MLNNNLLLQYVTVYLDIYLLHDALFLPSFSNCEYYFYNNTYVVFFKAHSTHIFKYFSAAQFVHLISVLGEMCRETKDQSECKGN